MVKSAPILYFFPDNQIPDHLTKRLKTHTKNPRSKGPGDRMGLLISPFEDVLPVYTPDEQRWSEINGTWLGAPKNASPADFAREHIYSGYPVKLGDENEWVIPIALLDTPNFSLPQYEIMDKTGNWIWQVSEKFEFICQVAGRLFDAVDDEGDFALDEDILRRACCAAIGVNYNLTEEECGALRILTRAAYQGIISALLDQPGIKQMLDGIDNKKKNLDS